MTSKERAYRIMLEDPTQFVSKTTIKHFIGASNEDVINNIFNECKRIERLKTPKEFDARPTKVQKKLVFKVTGIDYNFALKQYLADQDRKESL
ncbi:hypothetical protein [Erysipelothrix aquatica]|uniref:hypothetical protein n=1 Tax=Erysipelothrix aquatica TaxID=2683714 RepID=UPI001358B936|nr:hypothetical protein [Erysipelothrix aquatica]